MLGKMGASAMLLLLGLGSLRAELMGFEGLKPMGHTFTSMGSPVMNGQGTEGMTGKGAQGSAFAATLAAPVMKSTPPTPFRSTPQSVGALTRSGTSLLSNQERAPLTTRRVSTSSMTPPGKPHQELPVALAKAQELAPGVAAATFIASAGFMAANGLGNCVSGIPCAILLGMIARTFHNGTLATQDLEAGLTFCTKTILQCGIVCVGAKLSLLDVATLGPVGLPVVFASICSGLTFVPWFGRKLGLPPKMSTLVAAGTSICGVTAISAVAPAIKADPQEVSFAIANVVAFGTFGMFVYPMIAHFLFQASAQVGMFLGIAIHDTSQVMGAAMSYKLMYADDIALKVAAVTKLTRNLCLAAVVPSLAYMHARADGRETEDKGQPALKRAAHSVAKYTPAFVVGFAFMTILRTIGDVMVSNGMLAYGLLETAKWKAVVTAVGSTASLPLLGVAMAAVGLKTSLSQLRGVGVKPFILGFAGSSVVGTVGFTMITALGMAGFF